MPILGKVDQIESLLKASEYTYPESNPTVALISYDELRSAIGASDHEIDDALNKLNVVHLNGKLRMLSKTQFQQNMRLFLDTVIEKDWDINAISQSICLKELPEVNEVFLVCILTTLSNKISQNGIWELDHRKIGRFTADVLFRNRVDATKVSLILMKRFDSSLTSFTSSYGMRKILCQFGLLNYQEISQILRKSCYKELP